jgi:hypothetical protein
VSALPSFDIRYGSLTDARLVAESGLRQLGFQAPLLDRTPQGSIVTYGHMFLQAEKRLER